ncbi:MAG: glycosyltransferase [Firmicutes bacterium]|nr:glycosyltransferase [Bacillota bacterium]
MKLSIVMMVKNEEKYLRECLEALRPLRKAVDSELIIVDTGSEDRTVEIARQFTDKVYFHPWNNDFAAMRNKTIEYATGEWLLVLDGDEILADARGLIRFLKSPDSKKYKTGILTFRNITSLVDESAYITGYLPRLFRNENFYYKGSIHEQPQFQYPVCAIPGEIVHYGYLSTDKELMEYKFRRNVGILKEELAKEPDNVYYWFQLSQSYGMYQDYENALEAALKAYRVACGRMKADELAGYMYIFVQLALCYMWNKRYEDVEAVCREALEIKKGYLDLYYLLAEAQRALGRDREAIKNYREYLRLYLDGSYLVDASMSNKTAGKYEHAYLSLAALYHKLKEDEAALRYAKKINSEKVFRQAIPIIVEIYAKEGKFARLWEFYKDKIEDKDDALVETFFVVLENTLPKLKNQEKSERLIELFTSPGGDYALLYRVKQLILQDKSEMPQELYNAVKEIDYHKMPVFFADILYWFIKNKHELTGLTCRFRLPLIQSHLAYLAQKHKDFSEKAFAYLQAVPQASGLAAAKINKELAKTVLFADNCTEEQYRYAFRRYLAEGACYLAQVYNPAIIESGRDSDFACDEDAFLYYLQQAQKFQETDKTEYVKHLRHALRLYPAMKKGIEILLADVQKEMARESGKEKSRIAENAEFQLLKVQLKENIQMLMDAGRFGEAKNIINQYLSLVPNDEEMVVLQAHLDAVQKQNAKNPHSKDLIISEERYPKVTIIIPTYNQKGFLKEAIEGCLKQDYPNLEIIVGDDCSTDGTHLMMKKYKRYPQIKYIRNSKNLGAGNNSQYLLENHATGKYGMILNHDDYLIKEDYITKAVNLLLENPGLSFVWANCLINDENSGKQSPTNYKIPNIVKGIDYFKYYETEKYPHITGTLTTVFDLEKLKKTNFGQEKTKIRDTFLYLNLMLVGDVGFIDENVAVYRVHKQSISNNLPKEFDLSTIREFEKMKSYVLEQKIASVKEMEMWINRRVFAFILWRFRVLWSNNEKKYALKLLNETAKDYPIVYEHVLNNI